MVAETLSHCSTILDRLRIVSPNATTYTWEGKVVTRKEFEKKALEWKEKQKHVYHPVEPPSLLIS